MSRFPSIDLARVLLGGIAPLLMIGMLVLSPATAAGATEESPLHDGVAGAATAERGDLPDAGEEQAPSGVRLFLDDREVFLADPIQIREGRTYLPLRACFETLGAEVNWQEGFHAVSVVRGRVEAVFAVNSGVYAVNGVIMDMADATLYLDSARNRSYVPVRYGAETFGFAVEWISAESGEAVHIRSTPSSNGELGDNEMSIGGRIIWLGQSEEQLYRSLGYPSRIDESTYGLQWYVYNRDYTAFVMVGMQDGRVRGFFSNGLRLGLKNGLGYGAAKRDVDAAGFSADTMRLWFDPFDEDRLYAVFCMAEFPDNTARQALFEQDQERLLLAYEMENLDITNAFRLANGRREARYNRYAADAALAYAKEMAERDFWGHVDPEGMPPLERLERRGIYAYRVSENLAGGYSDAMHVFKAWIESDTHRQGMLEDIEYLGVGAYYKPDSEFRFYVVQEFVTLHAPDA